MKKRIIIIGKGGSGKDYAKNILVKNGYLNDISLTTRKPREGEVSGEIYDFISEESFLMLAENSNFVQYNHFVSNNCYYGTTVESFNKNHVFIMSPEAMLALSQEDKDSSFILYLDISLDIRRERLLMRKNTYCVETRLACDDVDFASFCEYDYKLSDPQFSEEFLLELIEKNTQICSSAK
jgi:guanylate kinase